MIDVGRRFISDIELSTPELYDALAQKMAAVHVSIDKANKKFLAKERRYNCTTPKSFLELINSYKKLVEKRLQIETQTICLDNGLEALAETTAQVETVRAELEVKFLKLKYGQRFKLESYAVDSNTVSNIENVITTGKCLTLVNFDQDLLQLIEPLIEMKHKAVVNKLYKKHIFNEEEREKNQRNQSEEPQLVVMDQDAEQLSFHDKKLKLHNNFRLVLTGNDLSHEDTWKKLVSGMLMNYCFPGDKETSLNKYFKERLFHDTNEEFNLLFCVKCAKQEEIGNLDAMFVEEL